jgi:hypothetical protein
VQDFPGAEAVFPRGVDVAADAEAVLGDVVDGQAAGDFLLGLERADAALADVISRPDRRAGGEAEHVGLAATAELGHLAAGLLLHGVLRPGDAGHGGEADGDGAAELQFQRLADR